MKKRFTFFVGSLLFSMAAMAQSYSLSDLSESDFMSGSSTLWSFEKYEFSTGKFTKLTTNGDGSMANYLDIYNPERVGGKRITEIDGVTANGNKTIASNIRNAWYDEANDGSATASQLVYVARDPREGFGYEIYGTSVSASTITFTVPADGYYTASGSVIREDNGLGTALSLTPVYRFSTQTDDTQLGTMGIAIAYGGDGKEIDGTSGWSLAQGASQRYTEQTPTTFTFAFHAVKGDKIAFLVNGATDPDRGAWARTFAQSLVLTATDAATAQATDNYVDPYDNSKVQVFQDLLDEYSDMAMGLDDMVGTGVGQYPQEAVDAFNEVINKLSELVDAGKINSMNAAVYTTQLQNAWQVLKENEIEIDYTATNNFRLIYSTGSLAHNNLTISCGVTETNNDDNPWGFYSYDAANGTYSKFTKFGQKAKAGPDDGKDCWYTNDGDWWYISTGALVHPRSTTVGSAFVFTAPADGVYRVTADAYRYNPNTKVENPLTLTSRYMDSQTTECSNDRFVAQKSYGSVTNDGEKGKAPVNIDYFVNLKKGDKVTMEIGAPTAVSSAATQFTNLAITSRKSDSDIYTVETAQASGLDFYNPYGTGDPTELQAAVDSANVLINLAKGNNGEGDGQYDTGYYEALASLVAQATELLAAGSTQAEFDQLVHDLTNAINDLKTSRKGFHLEVSGDYIVMISGTDKHLTQNNAAGDYYYANFFNEEGVKNDANRNKADVSEYNWVFTFTPSADDPQKILITNENGWLEQDAYITKGVDPDPSIHTFEIFTENKGDSKVAIRKYDGNYWKGNISWHSPYNRIDTSSTPQYIFELVSASSTGIQGTTAAGTPVSTAWYSTDGRQVQQPGQGIYIVRQKLSDGTVKTMKIVRK
jgi:hypothetical protein